MPRLFRSQAPRWHQIFRQRRQWLWPVWKEILHRRGAFASSEPRPWALWRGSRWHRRHHCCQHRWRHQRHHCSRLICCRQRPSSNRTRYEGRLTNCFLSYFFIKICCHKWNDLTVLLPIPAKVAQNKSEQNPPLQISLSCRLGNSIFFIGFLLNECWQKTWVC